MLLFFRIISLVLLLASSALRANEPDIIINGLNDEQLANVRAFLSLSEEKCQAPKWRIEQLFAKADAEIGKALRALGCYQPKTDKQLSFQDDCWQARFTIAAGDPVIISELNVVVIGEAQQEAAFQKLLANLPLRQGDTLNHALYEKIKQDLHSLSLEYGFLNSTLSKKSMRVDPEKKQAVIELIFDSGARHRFGEIKIDQDILNPEFVQRFISVKTGDVYSSKKLAENYNRLANSIYFSNVEIKPQMAAAENHEVPLHIKLTARKKHSFSTGIGFDTDIGPLLSLGYQNRRLNRAGHRLSLDVDFSPVLSSAESHYMIPFAEPRNDHISIGLGYKYENPDSFESEEVKFSVQYQHHYANGWNQLIFLDMSYENFTIDNVQRHTKLLVPGGRWQYTQSNDPLRPTRGYHLSVSLAATPESFISDLSFVQAKAMGKFINPLPWPARLISRIHLGATLTDDFERLPTAYRFYAGGGETIRGYEYKELGPLDNENEVIGGKMLTIVSAEYEHFISEDWGIAAFIDAGNAYNANNIKINKGTGLGVRWTSPIGPVRLDFAVPLDESDSSFQIHFAAGVQL